MSLCRYRAAASPRVVWPSAGMLHTSVVAASECACATRCSRASAVVKLLSLCAAQPAPSWQHSRPHHHRRLFVTCPGHSELLEQHREQKQRCKRGGWAPARPSTPLDGPDHCQNTCINRFVCIVGHVVQGGRTRQRCGHLARIGLVSSDSEPSPSRKAAGAVDEASQRLFWPETGFVRQISCRGAGGCCGLSPRPECM